MTHDEIDALKQQLDWLRPQMHIELPVSVVRELLAMIDEARHEVEALEGAED